MQGRSKRKVPTGNLLGVLLLAEGLAFMAAGFFRGEVQEVLLKAVNICLECIGIG